MGCRIGGRCVPGRNGVQCVLHVVLASDSISPVDQRMGISLADLVGDSACTEAQTQRQYFEEVLAE